MLAIFLFFSYINIRNVTYIIRNVRNFRISFSQMNYINVKLLEFAYRILVITIQSFKKCYVLRAYSICSRRCPARILAVDPCVTTSG